MTTSSLTVYDSAQARRPFITEFRNFVNYRALIRLLVGRDLTVRYKRSVLGVWWTIIGPLIQTAVMFVVFSQLFQRTGRGDIPFIVYLLSGIIIVTFFAQGTVSSGSSIVSSRNILVKVYVPPEVFSVSAAVSALVNFTIMLVPLILFQLVTGVGIPWTFLLIPIPAFAMLALVAGLGLILGAAAVHFYDVLDLAKVLAGLMTWLVPTFYTLEMIPNEFVPFIKANPLYSYLEVFRGFAWGGEFAPWWNFAVMAATSIIGLSLGVYVFSRSWKNLVGML